MNYFMGFIIGASLALNIIFFDKIDLIKERLDTIESQKTMPLTCSIKDSHGRYVCRYVEVEPIFVNRNTK